MRWLKQHYTGYVRVRLTGRSPERFFNLCRSSKILLWNIACVKEEYRFFLLLPDFYRIRPFARKAGVRVRIQEKLGLPFFLYRNRKRKLFAVGAASFFLLLFVLSRFIWNISFSGNLLFTDDMLTGQLREIGVCYGMPKRGVDCDRIEEELRSRCSRIVWVSAHVSGTRLQIRIRENETADGIPLREESPRNLVAETAGTVVSILVRAGKAADSGRRDAAGHQRFRGGGADSVCAGRCRYPSADNEDLQGMGAALSDSAELYRKEAAGLSPAGRSSGYSGHASVSRETKLGSDRCFQTDRFIRRFFSSGLDRINYGQGV